MNCGDIMKKSVVFLSREDTCYTAAKLMSDSNVGFLPVCEDQKVIGTLTDRDICIRVVAFDRPASTLVGDVMTRDVIACLPDDSIEKAAQTMADNQVSRLLICAPNGILQGIISLSDLPQINAEQAFQAFQGVTERESPVPPT
ncbi:MAG TPA: CBS domain-containing protein [Myxococcales bacterium]|jgi:CBS domain-containing protein